MPAAGTSILIGAVIGGVTALVTGGNVGKGALFGAIGGGISSMFSPAASGISAAGDAIGPAAATAGGVGAEAAMTTTEALAQSIGGFDIADAALGAQFSADTLGGGLINAVSGFGPADASLVDASFNSGNAFSADFLNAGAQPDVGTGADFLEAGAPAVTPGEVAAPAPATSGPYGGYAMPAPTAPPSPALWQQALSWWATVDPTVKAGVLQGAGSMLGGIGKGIGDYMTAERKAELDLENQKAILYAYQQFIGQSGRGGIGVNLGVSAPSVTRPLTRPGTGVPVYGSTGLINSV